MATIARGSFALASLVTLAAPALAGIADSPLPKLAPGKVTLHVSSVPGNIGRSMRVFGVRPYQPSPRRVSQPAALP
jgi:hypothetical protein